MDDVFPGLTKDLSGFEIIAPPPPRWAMTFSSNSEFQIHLHDAPSWFHRLMQRLVLGIGWRRLP